eukprot:CAMPEP_0175446704 /NCGR_PEP_ID=MMETSP0095-20121207/60421_1 /TAXON_ID=311494 /ORGANISM="Alexandrium monilatum, Strain CCMP3105" /LENGTH=173 /DNA_ID=CAMNT_0016747013 /DNA_START=26 /DNA_END=542 /DNA_ORIENTATION=-
MTILKARTAGTSRPLSELPSDSSISVAHSAPSSSSAVVDLDHVAGDSQSVASAAEREALIPAPSMQGVGSDARPTVASRTTMVLSLAPPAVPAVPVSKFASTALFLRERLEQPSEALPCLPRGCLDGHLHAHWLASRVNWTSKSLSFAAVSSMTSTRRTSAESISALLHESRG